MSAAASASREGVDNFRRRLHQLDEHALAADGRIGTALRMQERDVVTGSAFPNSARSKPHTLTAVRRAGMAEADRTRLGREPLHSDGQVIDPKSDVVKGGTVYSLGSSIREDGIEGQEGREKE